MAMTTDEAIQINAELLRRAKGRRGNPNWEEWYGVRCAMCAHYVQEGEHYLNWIPAMYKDRAKADTKIMHASCLVLGDGSSYNYSKKEAVYKGGGPLLTNDLIYDIINGKETDDSD